MDFVLTSMPTRLFGRNLRYSYMSSRRKKENFDRNQAHAARVRTIQEWSATNINQIVRNRKVISSAV